MFDFSACVLYASNTPSDNWVITTVGSVSQGYSLGAGFSKWWVITNQQYYTPVTCSSISNCLSSLGNSASNTFAYTGIFDNLSYNSIRIRV